MGTLEKKIKKGTISYWKDGVMELKQCTKCKEIKLVERFSRRGNGYTNKCKECEKQYRDASKEVRKEYRKENITHIKEKQKQWRENNKEHIKEKNRQYQKENAETIKEKKRQYQKEHIEHIKKYLKEYSKQYYQNNKEYIKQHEKQKYKIRKENNLKGITDLLEQVNPLFEQLNLPVYGVIYKIENIKTGKVYIGQTILQLKERYGDNIVKSWIKERINRDNQKFKEELIEEDFEVTEVLDVGCCKWHLDKLEVHYIDKYNSFLNGYNNREGNHNTDDGIEEFNKILEENNLEFIDGKLVNKCKR